MENKKLALIGSYCHTKEQLDVLENTLKEWKKLDVDTMLLSPLHLPPHIIEMCDYYFYTKENPILHWPTRAQVFYYKFKGITLNKFELDYGWARLYQMKKLAEIAATYDYDIFYQTEYDLLIDDYVKKYIYNHTNNLITRRIVPKSTEVRFFDASLHFICLNKEKLSKVKDYITLERYLHNSQGKAEDQALMWSQEFDIPIDNDGYVVDLIYNFDQYQIENHWEDNFIFNQSLSKDYKIFFENTHTLGSTLKFVIFETNGNEINVAVNGTEFYGVEEWKIYDTGVQIQELQNVVVNGDQYIDVIKKIYYNTVEIEL